MAKSKAASLASIAKSGTTAPLPSIDKSTDANTQARDLETMKRYFTEAARPDDGCADRLAPSHRLLRQ